jgi:hypothetical protein
MTHIGFADRPIPVPSQRSIVCAADLAERINLAFRIHIAELMQDGPELDLGSELSNPWWKLLYQNDFDDWMVTHAQTTFEFMWLNVLVKLRNRSFQESARFCDDVRVRCKKRYREKSAQPGRCTQSPEDRLACNYSPSAIRGRQ